MGEGDRVEGRVDVVLTARMAGSTACPHTALLYEAKRPGTLWGHEWNSLVGSDGQTIGNVERISRQARKYLTSFMHPEIVIGDGTALVGFKTDLYQLQKTSPEIPGAEMFYTNDPRQFLPALVSVCL
jgi:hypothetical protein